jgi:ABC-type sugar transport system ATPase subunit
LPSDGPAAPAADYTHVVRRENIRMTFGNVTALRNVNLEVGRNEIVGLIGDNRAGKSTVIKIMTGVLPPTAGRLFIRDREVRLDDYSVQKLSGGERQGVAIGRAMHFASDLIVLDEPTVALAIKELRKVLDFVRSIKARGEVTLRGPHRLPERPPVGPPRRPRPL